MKPAGIYESPSADDCRAKTVVADQRATITSAGVTEWNDLINLPPDVSTEVKIRIYASLESGYTLGQGELLRKSSITVGELLERNRSSRPSLNNLASALPMRFSQRGDGKDLDEAIQHHRVALQLTPAGHPHHSSSLNNLANALSTRFSQRGDGKDLDETIQHPRISLQLRPERHPLRSPSLNNHANAIYFHGILPIHAY
ncbi:hypothetical protein HYDPIDRAFT_114676 [Hydnomerulius pinastri MD-312]|uniref:Uncharacterized protein n=1 Tax=Hydnomerulius pinastri MD-312 TaxID=994086 RepID=A0A0C9W618_9AGAM|nr:hypothetical protein HYDPIDRAFT_114676 [Hydnomerulius pinastri MD-312]